VALAADLDVAGPPVQSVKLKPGNLGRAQAEPCEEHENREIARADQARPVARRKHPLDLGPRQRLRDGRPRASFRRTARASPGSASPRTLKNRSSERNG
jgi:hypothetical protein